METKNEKNIQKQTSVQFTKEQLINSMKYRDCSDLLNALLESGRSYTSEETDSIIRAFYKKGGV